MLRCRPLRKKGGIFIKKILFFLITIICFQAFHVKAEHAFFYEAEYLDNIYLKRYQSSTNKTYYQQARVYRQQGTDDVVYCLEPFSWLDGGMMYDSTPTPNYLTPNQIEEIKMIAHFGYGYENHRDKKWIAITQIMLWKTVDPTGDFYFTDSLNGNRVNLYEEEMKEIRTLIDTYSIIPSFANQTFDIVEDHNLVLEDTTNTISLFNIKDNTIEIDGNILKTDNLKEGIYEFNFSKGNSNNPTLFYLSDYSQNLVKRANLDKKTIKLTINVQKTNLEVTKIDQDTKTTTPQGEAKIGRAHV